MNKTKNKKTTEETKETIKVKQTRKNRTFAPDVVQTVEPVIKQIKSLINHPSEDVLKMLRLELRKAVRETRGVLRSKKTAQETVTAE